jgi:hypothetical protein
MGSLLGNRAVFYMEWDPAFVEKASFPPIVSALKKKRGKSYGLIWRDLTP